MPPIPDCLVLDNVPKIETMEYQDAFIEALQAALTYRNEELRRRFPRGMFEAVSGFTGRGWLNGFDDSAFYWERYGVKNPAPNFAVSGLEAYLKHAGSLYDAVRFLDRAPAFLWNLGSDYAVDANQSAAFRSGAREVSGADIRQYVVETLAEQGRPVIILLHLPEIAVVEMALVTGFEGRGEMIYFRSPCQEVAHNQAGPFGYGSMLDWERNTLAVMGVGEARPAGWDRHICYLAAQNTLCCGQSYTEGTRHYGLAAYDAWERAILDEEAFQGVDDFTLSYRLLYHSSVAGNFASQKAFATLPGPGEGIPCMGVLHGLLRRAQAGPVLIHGLMWDVWQIAGGYWRGIKEGTGGHWLRWTDDDDLRRFRSRSVREQTVQVIRRARQVDADSMRDLEQAIREWDLCLGRGENHPCPCFDRRCPRIRVYGAG